MVLVLSKEKTMRISFFLLEERERENRWCSRYAERLLDRSMDYSRNEIDPNSGSTTGYLNAAQSHCARLPFVGM